MNPPNKITDAEIRQILDLKSKGFSSIEIARQIGRSSSKCRKIMKAKMLEAQKPPRRYFNVDQYFTNNMAV